MWEKMETVKVSGWDGEDFKIRLLFSFQCGLGFGLVSLILEKKMKQCIGVEIKGWKCLKKS